MSTLKLNSIIKTFKDTKVIKGVDLEVNHGEFVVFVGPSGCGKSTLLRIIAGLETETSGEIIIDDVCVNNVSAAQRGCAMVFQSYALYPHMTVYENMAFGLENAKVDKKLIVEKVTAAAKLLRLDELLKRKPTQLSGGQRQRVAIGRAIVREPKLFLFDEPLSNLDAELRVSMRAELRDLHTRIVGSTMIYVTHDQVEAMTMADRIVVLRDGIIEQVGTPVELFERPVNTFVGGFIGSPRMNFINRETLIKFSQNFEKHQLGANINIKSFGIRPEHINIQTSEIADNEHIGGLSLLLQQVEYLGAAELLQGVLDDGTRIEVMLHSVVRARKGDKVNISFSCQHLHCFNADGKRI